MTYTEIVTLMPAWAWLIVAGGCVLTALFLFAWFLPTLEWEWLIADDPYELPAFPAVEQGPFNWADEDWGWDEGEAA